MTDNEKMLLTALSMMVVQYLEEKDGRVYSLSMDAGEHAIEALKAFGLMESEHPASGRWTEAGEAFIAEDWNRIFGHLKPNRATAKIKLGHQGIKQSSTRPRKRTYCELGTNRVHPVPSDPARFRSADPGKPFVRQANPIHKEHPDGPRRPAYR